MSPDDRIERLIDPDQNRIGSLAAVVAAAWQFQQENTRQARRLLVGTVRDCLEDIIGREPARAEIIQVLGKEV